MAGTPRHHICAFPQRLTPARPQRSQHPWSNAPVASSAFHGVRDSACFVFEIHEPQNYRKRKVLGTTPSQLVSRPGPNEEDALTWAADHMHPRLTLENNQACVEQIQALQKCHEDNSYLQKLLGACNDPKHALSACFKGQKKVPPRALRATEIPGPAADMPLNHIRAHAIAAEGQGQPGHGARQPREGGAPVGRVRPEATAEQLSGTSAKRLELSPTHGGQQPHGGHLLPCSTPTGIIHFRGDPFGLPAPAADSFGAPSSRSRRTCPTSRCLLSVLQARAQLNPSKSRAQV